MKTRYIRNAVLIMSLIVLSESALASCKPQVYGTGTGFNKAAAELAARLSWNANALSWYGAAYASWPKSQNKSSVTKKIKFGSWTSTFYADPCN
jgi:hypothetical protein